MHLPAFGCAGHLATAFESEAFATAGKRGHRLACPVCLVLCSDAWEAVNAAAAQSEAGALEGQDVGVRDDAVDLCGHHGRSTPRHAYIVTTTGNGHGLSEALNGNGVVALS